MTYLVPNKHNTAAFYDDYCGLLITLIRFEYLLTDERYKDYTYRHQIWATEEGWYLTFQTYDKKTGEPCIIR